ncbi:MAG: hypothetical protein AAGH76_03055 [Pseudomonadota bacterium]
MLKRPRTRKGQIVYRVNDSAFPDGEWGSEDFVITAHADGTRVLRAHCQLWDGDGLIRDVVKCVDADYHPRDVYVRLTSNDTFQGLAAYHFTDEQAEMHARFGGDIVHDKRPYNRSMRSFGTHALTSDAWMAARFDRSAGPRRHVFENNLMTSTDHRGATGPEFTATTRSEWEFFGEEHVSVAAGDFDCYHFAILANNTDHPPYHFWMTADGDFLFVRGTVAAPYEWEFELLRLEDSA